ncbi:hypothetical protein P153DRAFT_129 [Dothidotthia symphoricarpi CBS 119687]|uniref:Uncharacterized protein n=1 Tax=Dothidotthia symphoricarpi CBS 119687 TaxID=1392245 RepID=A0A6A6AS34_9PLEO|nr:uncharacterized protein P153DRAFT_129 [Dothidotthia symphoricarpi CBS 119687]KAF2134366.1 hypothetical protein P153DRAFT_129 [Dothidotthia symphoricarpi CBS 119687]
MQLCVTVVGANGSTTNQSTSEQWMNKSPSQVKTYQTHPTKNRSRSYLKPHHHHETRSSDSNGRVRRGSLLITQGPVPKLPSKPLTDNHSPAPLRPCPALLRTIHRKRVRVMCLAGMTHVICVRLLLSLAGRSHPHALLYKMRTSSKSVSGVSISTYQPINLPCM